MLIVLASQEKQSGIYPLGTMNVYKNTLVGILRCGPKPLSATLAH